MKLLSIIALFMLISVGTMTAFLEICKTNTEPDTKYAEITNQITYNAPDQQLSLMSMLPEPPPEPEPEPVSEVVAEIIEAPAKDVTITQVSHLAGIEVGERAETSIDEIKKIVSEMCEKYKVEENLVLAVIQVESNFKADVVSKTGDYGLMQINKCNHEYFKKLLGVTDFLDPRQNIEVGVYILKDLIYNYKCETEEQLLMAYNRGYSGAKKYWDKGIVSNTYSTKVLEAKAALEK